MKELVLTLRSGLAWRVDASALLPDRLAKLTPSAINKLELQLEGGEAVPLSQLMTVSGEPSQRVRLVGDLSRFDSLGAGMASGRLHVEGNVGCRLGHRLAGGRIKVTGHAGDDVGSEMSGGQIVLRGSVGKRTGSAGPGGKRGMMGGEIVVFGTAGEQTGAFMRRGVIAVAGAVGPDVLRTAIAGTVVAAGDVASPAARWSKRASLVAMNAVSVSPTYRYACTYQPGFLRVLLLHLRRTYGFPVKAEHLDGLYRRYAGDFAESGRGEILHRLAE